MKGTTAAVVERFRTQNLEAAVAILADPHADPESLGYQWAERVIAHDREWELTAS